LDGIKQNICEQVEREQEIPSRYFYGNLIKNFDKLEIEEGWESLD
jgi:hypothetical protein